VKPAPTRGASAAVISSILARGIGALKTMACDRRQVCAEWGGPARGGEERGGRLPRLNAQHAPPKLWSPQCPNRTRW
jgi:hypothetical protein